jgi:glycosyltransferase involved in cell wall biosynthesis
VSINRRIVIGIWTEWPRGASWSNEGMTRLLGFLIEGAAVSGRYAFRVVANSFVAEEIRVDFAHLKATKGLDYDIHSPNGTDDPADPLQIKACLALGNALPDVQAWIILYPYFSHGLGLDRPVSVIFPDSNPTQYPTFGGTAWSAAGEHTTWRDRVARTLRGASRVITFSHHVAVRQAEAEYKVPAPKLRVVPHAPPDLQPQLPFLNDRRGDRTSRARAGALLRDHARRNGHAFFADFPFEDTRYAVVSTQDRTTKNIVIVARALRHLVREEFEDLFVITTAPIHYGANWTLLPQYLIDMGLQHQFTSLTSLPRDVHAALYHCSAVTVHPSLFEGGLGPFPFYESVSVGTPCLMALGPHVYELLEDEPALTPFTFDPDDDISLSELIKQTIAMREDALTAQQKVYDRLLLRSWADAADAYAEVALEATT